MISMNAIDAQNYKTKTKHPSIIISI